MRLGILGSTRGSNFLSLQKAIEARQLEAASIELVISNRENALILERAKFFNIPNFCVNDHDPIEQEQLISRLLQDFCIDLVILSGYMKILSSAFVSKWKNKLINVHPSLLPAYAGMMDLAVHTAVLSDKQKETGCTVHFVDEVVDSGEIILQKKLKVMDFDTPETLKSRVQTLEAQALIETIRRLQQ